MMIRRPATEEDEPGFARQLRLDLDEADVARVLDVFVADLDRLSAVIDAAAQEGQGAALRRAAHALFGAAATVGAERLQAACHAAMTDDADAPQRLARHAGAVAQARLGAAAALRRVMAELALP